MILGNCLCGQCSFEAHGELFDVLHCHCSNCRKLTGSAFATYGGVLTSQFNWVCEKSNIGKFQSSQNVSRYFCKACGSLMVSIDKEEINTLYLSAGVLGSETDIKPQYHQYVASKVGWYEINDDLPQFMGESTV